MKNNKEIEWIKTTQNIQYEAAVEQMGKRIENIINGQKPECIWLLNHDHIYTAGTSAKQEDLIDPHKHNVIQTSRGGQYTYHGPGQRIAYTMLNLKDRKPDVKLFVHNLEEWIIQTLKTFNIKTHRRKDQIGVWTINPKTQKDTKIAAIGIKLKKWVSMHGIAININPDLEQYNAIIPCGIHDLNVTSVRDIGSGATIEEIDEELKKQFIKIFGNIIEKKQDNIENI